MNCPNCKTEMERGAISTAGASDTMWYSRKSLMSGILGHNLLAYKCPKCGKVELTTEMK